LTELLVVISIISIVSAITFGVLTRAKHSSKVATTIQNLRSLHQAAMLYQADYGGSTSGTIEEMGLPPTLGTVQPFLTSPHYLAEYYAQLKSPFRGSSAGHYQTFMIESALDGMPTRWKECTELKGDRCIMYFDQFEAGRDPETQGLNAWLAYFKKTLRGINLGGSLVTRTDFGIPLNQVWWITPW
jgi:type II secretory pathway pseudopilin PulG